MEKAFRDFQNYGQGLEETVRPMSVFLSLEGRLWAAGDVPGRGPGSRVDASSRSSWFTRFVVGAGVW